MMGGGDDMMPMMQEMMENLFSKEVMYPSLNEIGAKVNVICCSMRLIQMFLQYAPWLEQNRGKLSAQDLSNYTNQHKCIQRICAIYESTNLSAKEQSTKALEVMQQVTPQFLY